MQIELDTFLIDICTGSVLNYEQATQLWKLIGNKRKMLRAAEDANQRGYEATFHLATLGGFNEASSSIVDQGLFSNAPCSHCKYFFPKERCFDVIQWCHAEEQFQDFSCFRHKG